MPRKRHSDMIATATATPPPEYLTPQEVADILRVDVMEVYRLRQDGELPGIKFGHRTLRFKREDLDAFLTSHKDAPSA